MSGQSSTSHTRPHILIAEDDRATAEMLMMLLEMEDYGVTWVATPDAALAVLTGETGNAADRPPFPDIVLLDLQLPSMNGPELMRRVKLRCPAPPPVIVISAWREAAAAAAAKEIGAAHLLTKPFEVDDLLACIADVETRLAAREE